MLIVLIKLVHVYCLGLAAQVSNVVHGPLA